MSYRLLKGIVVIASTLITTATHAQFPWVSAHAPWKVQDPRCLYTDTVNDNFYLAGTVWYPGDSTDYVNTIYRLHGTEWDTLGRFGAEIWSVINWHDTILVAGGFVSINGAPLNRIAGYANGTWFPYGLFNGTCTRLRILNGELYIVGSFEHCDGQPCTCVAKRVGDHWEPVGLLPDFNAAVYDITLHNGELVIGGALYFDEPGAGVMRFDGSAWHMLGGGIYGNAAVVYTVASYKDELYVGGVFFQDQGNPANNLMRYNGTEWRSLEDGPQWEDGNFDIPSTIEHILVHDDLLWVTGKFRYVDHLPASYIAHWDGLNWCGLEGEFPDNMWPARIGFYHDTLFFGISHPILYGDTVNKLVRYEGETIYDTCTTLQVEVQEVGALAAPQVVVDAAAQTITVQLPLQGPARDVQLLDVTGRALAVRRGSRVVFGTAGRGAGVYVVQVEGSPPVKVVVP